MRITLILITFSLLSFTVPKKIYLASVVFNDIHLTISKIVIARDYKSADQIFRLWLQKGKNTKNQPIPTNPNHYLILEQKEKDILK